MYNPTELYCTYDIEREEWQVWFPHPLGGKHILETFSDSDEAHKFWADQKDSADFDTT